MSAKTRSERRALRRKISESIERTTQALAKKREASPPDEKQSKKKSQDTKSRKELKYQPHRAKGTKFLDSKRRAYQVSDAGELRALDKPTSREKRRRKERSEENQKRESD